MFKNKWLYCLTFVLLMFFLSFSAATNTTSNGGVLTDIPRSEIDQTKQTFLRLNNDMKVLVIEDPDATQSMVAIDVAAGHYQEPEQQIGLAHFLEHAIFMGSEKYSQADNMFNFVANNGGLTNATTYNTNTIFFFSARVEALQEGLDRMTDALAKPLLQDKTSLAELKNVESEFQKRRYDIFLQYLDAMAETICNPEHPICKQPTGGNLRSLSNKPNSNLMSELRKFHQQYYSSNLMTAVIYSKLPTKDLIALAKEYFSRIPNKQVKLPEVAAKRLIQKQNLLHLHSENKARVIELNFQIPKFKNNFAAFSYIDYLLQNKQSNTAFDVLSKNNLISGLSSSYEVTYLEPEDEFSIHVSLTDKGVRQQDLVVNTIFNYLELIKSKGVQQSYFKQLKQTLFNNFSQLKISYSMDYIMLLSSLMQELPENRLYNYYLIPDNMTPQEIVNTLDYITLKNANITYASKQEKYDHTSKYYQAKYSIEPYSVDRFSNKTVGKNFSLQLQLPPLNNYITTDFSLNNSKQLNTRSKPELLKNPYDILIYAMPSQFFRDNPKAYLSIQVTSPLILAQDKNYVIPYLATTIFLKHYTGDFSRYDLANINWVYHLADGQFIFLQGIPQYMLNLSKDLLTKFKTFSFDQSEALEQTKIQLKQNLIEKMSNMGALESALEVLDVFTNVFISDSKVITTLPSITLKDLTEYQKSLLGETKTKIFSFGNLNDKQTLAVVKMVEEIFPSKLKDYPAIYFPDMKAQKLVFTKKISQDNNAFMAAYYLPTKSILENMVYARFLSHILDDAFFYRLRTKKQLGYTASASELKLADGGAILTFFVESPKATPKELYQNTKEFYQEALQILKDMPDNQFNQFKTTIHTNLTGIPKDLQDEFDEHHTDFKINNTGKQVFDQLAEITLQIKRQDLIDFFQKAVIDETGFVLLSEVIGKNQNESAFVIPQNYQRYRDLDQLHKIITFSPLNLHSTTETK